MLFNLIVTVFNWIIKGLGSALALIISVLPDSPFKLMMDSPVSHMYGYLNWIVPVGPILSTMQLWLVAVAGFYVYKIVLRWSKAI